jgi:type I restriction enzyme S subunit
MLKENWTYKKFSEVFNLQMGKTPSRDNLAYWGGNNVWVSIADLKDKYIESSKEHITDIAVSESGINKVPQGTAIMSFKLTIGRAAITKCDLFTNEAIMSFEPKDKNILAADYIYYFLKGCKWTGANKAVMGQTLNKKTISENIFAYPPLETQSRIVSELDLLQSIIDKQQAQLKELDKLAQAVFYDMFGDPVENEKGWEVKKMCEVCNIGSSRRIFAEEYVEEGIPFYRSKEIIELSKGTPISVELFISEKRYLEIKKNNGIPSVGDLLITAVGTIGEIWIVDSDKPFYYKDGNIVWLSQISTSVSSLFFQFSLHKLIDEYKKKMSIGSAYSALTIVNLKKLDVIVPPLSLQQSFATKIESIEKQKAAISQSIAETQKLFDYTMDKYFG